MAEEKSRVGKFLSALASPFKRRPTPAPTMLPWTTGIKNQC